MMEKRNGPKYKEERKKHSKVVQGEKVRWGDGENDRWAQRREGLLGSALRQSRAYDSFALGSVCACACAHKPGSLHKSAFVGVYIGMCVCIDASVHVLMFVPWRGASVYLGHFLGVERSQRERFSTCYPSILLSSRQLLLSIFILT